MADSDETSGTFEEILVAMDHSRHSRAALELAASMAELMQAKIHGVFVRDDQWVRISKMTSLAEIDELTGNISPIGSNSVEQEIRNLEKTIQEYFEFVSRRHQLSHTWSAVQGSVAEKVIEASQTSDIITIGSRGRSYIKSRKIGSSALAILQEAEKAVLILQDSHTLGPPVVVFDGSRRSISGLRIASDIAEKNETSLFVIDISKAFPSNKNGRSDLHEELRTTVRSEILELDEPDMGRFLLMVNKLQGGLLILPKNKRFTNRKVIGHTLDSADSPVLLAI